MRKQEAKIVKVRKARDRGIVLFCIFLIYISLPVMPSLWERFVLRVGNFANYFAAFILGLTGIFIIFYLAARQKGSSNFIWLIALTCVYAWCLSRLKLSIERIHFIEYGLLSIFVFRALRHNIKNKSIYLWSGIIVFFLGLLDEGIQYILPNRVYDARDVVVNGVAGVLGLCVIGLCIQPKIGHK